VSRLTLRSALARLEVEGLVRPMHGSGTRVLDFRQTGSVDIVGHLAQHALQDQPGVVPLALLSDLLEVRRAIAVEALALAAERATIEELRAMRDHIAVQRTLVGDPKRFVAADIAFARLVVRATHNIALELLFNTIVRLIDSGAGLEIAFLAEPERTLVVYEKLLDLLVAREPRAARKMARALLGKLDESVLARVSALVPSARDDISPSPPQPTRGS